MQYLSLVFDDGPSYPICEIADKIKAYGWSAGFAIMGRKINSDTLPMLKYLTQNGFQIISHGKEHIRTDELPSREEIESELFSPVNTVKEKLYYQITMARLPFLAQNDEVLQVAYDLNLPLMGNGIDAGGDWNKTTPPDIIAKAVLGSVRDGAIGCLHVLENTYKALDEILPELKNRDFCLVTPQELFLKKGVTPPLGVQINNVNDYL